MGNFVKNRRLGQAGNNHVVVPYGPTGARPDVPQFGSFRYNTSSGYLEYFNGTEFKSVSPTGAVDFIVDTFTGDNSTATFTLTEAPADTTQVIAFIGAIYQEPSTYTVSGYDITFTSAPPNSEKVNIIQGLQG